MAVQQPTQPPVAVVAPAEQVPVTRQASYNFRAAAIVWFIVGVADLFIAARFVGMLLGASTQSSFVNFIYQVSSPLVAPFKGIFPTSGATGNTFEPASLVALIVYAAVGWGLVTLIRIVTAPPGTKPAAS
jgi:uncharacterized protein YggT (Ycf19 family)